MASSCVAIQSILGSPLGFRNGLNNRSLLPHISQRKSNLLVRSISEDSEKSGVPPSAPRSTPPPPAKKSGADLRKVFSFSGPGPERINGRLAMVGFVAAIGAELANGGDLLNQISNGGVGWFVGTSVVLTLASLVPLFQGVTAESKSAGLMSADAEIWNGRMAMLGLVALAFTEYVQMGPLVHV
ncbi:unnamed protein product [Cuscuta campestris]|nr:unnamed protein product [Cuscuta campestris]